MTRVVVTFALDPELADRIRAVDPRIEVSVLGQDLLDALRGKRRFPSELQAATPLDEIRSALDEAEVMFGFWSGAMPSLVSPDDLPGALRWVQLTSAGADRVDPDLIRAGLTFTNVSGLHATPIAEYVLTYMLMFEKGWPALARNQAAGVYDRMVMPRNLSDRTVGVVGMGAIGAECARLAKAIGCRVLAIRRSVTERRPDAIADEVLPPGDLDVLLAESDYVVLAMPLTEETRGLIGAGELRTMGARGDRSYLINIARGEVVDEPALIEALRDGVIAGAALDVFYREPLPADSPLWELDNVILTPHISGGNENYNEAATSIFCDNLRRYLAGEELHNIIDPDRGY
ncbi:MAG: D-2-hydroxyacid dehydrogenase [Chloroflexi bacterium]|nr:D-2-hydroxyacid dehydrogenase [Chloroflexota bacterium]